MALELTFYVLCAGLCLQRMGFICMNSGVKVRAALTTAITRKAIGLGYISADNASRVVSFMANDINKIYDGMQVCCLSPLRIFADSNLRSSGGHR